MVVREIKLVGDPILRDKCSEVTDFESAKQVVVDLKDTLQEFRKKNGFGSGIAAPQIGVSTRAIYVSTQEFEGEMLNPKIIKHSKQTALFWDECFSFEAAFFAKVKRWVSIELEYQDLSGNRKTMKVTDEHLGTLLQHEIDHLNQILFIDRIVREGEYILSCNAWKQLGKPLKVK
ncbi:Peptide deformylase [Candidatus Bilamarchaeum dharawalense]|uniref:Peptide deformylase n=1 Tax=Candidatus Bilamarchaeum dharawalense TaxID=2885759 RepID=A0A5E4LNQ9_9ARCH|nr:Peptide deformylase [Candidatus Bilamarchaeum dharawalense]